MSRDLAHQLLDAAKAGRYVSEEAITQALIATGDITHEWPRPPEDVTSARAFPPEGTGV